MDRSQSSSRGVLGPLGLLLVAVLWLMTLSGNIPLGNSAAQGPQPGADSIEKSVFPPPIVAHGAVTTYPTTVPTTGTGA